MSAPLLIIDVAHPPRRPGDVEAELQDALRKAQASLSIRVIKVIHGYGSSGKGGMTRETVRNWGYANRKRIRSIIAGEEYRLTEEATQALRMEVGDYADPDIGAGNGGITVIWLR
jgi:hypothetical protein